MRRFGMNVYGMWLATAMACCAGGCVTITTGSLLDEMTDLDRLAELPSPTYVTKQFSSYDQKSTTPDDHENWFANRDRGQYLRTETNAGRQEFVMMDVDGPGAIVRIWSANPEGTLRVYLDGSDRPVIQEDMKIGVVYEQGNHGGLHYVNFSLDWLTDGKDSICSEQ